MNKLEKALKIFGEEYIAEIGNILQSNDKVATGKLLKSLDAKVFKTGFNTSYTLKVLANDYLKYIDEVDGQVQKLLQSRQLKSGQRLKD